MAKLQRSKIPWAYPFTATDLKQVGSLLQLHGLQDAGKYVPPLQTANSHNRNRTNKLKDTQETVQFLSFPRLSTRGLSTFGWGSGWCEGIKVLHWFRKWSRNYGEFKIQKLVSPRRHETSVIYSLLKYWKYNQGLLKLERKFYVYKPFRQFIVYNSFIMSLFWCIVQPHRNFSSIVPVFHIQSSSRIRICIEILKLNSDPHKTNSDPTHCLAHT
jgi:hypothetical protein